MYGHKVPLKYELGDCNMNRRDRRAALARGRAATPADIPALAAEATHAYQQRRLTDAEVICKKILARDPAHATALNVLGLLYQALDNHRLAAKMLAKAVAVNDLDAACHYNVAISYQALDERAAAATHFHKAIALGLSGKGVEPFLLQNPVIVECLSRMTDKMGLPVKNDGLFSARDIAAIADNTFLRCVLESTIIRGVTLEFFLTGLRYALLHLPGGNFSIKVDDDVLSLFCALAEQCFLNEYIFAQTADETQRCGSILRKILYVIDALSHAKRPPLLLQHVVDYNPIKFFRRRLRVSMPTLFGNHKSRSRNSRRKRLRGIQRGQKIIFGAKYEGRCTNFAQLI
jgi:tetratricopeptide (TPR) repeat protein